MRMSKNYKKICIALGLTGILGASTITAKSGTENVQATYRNIKVTYNDVTQSISNEPFLVNGSTYVPLRAVGDIFGVNATWDPSSNTVILSGGSTSSTAEAEIAKLNYQVATLTKQLNDVNTELAKYKSNSSNSGSTSTSGSNITTAQLQDTEDYLNKNFSDALHNNISLSYDLSLSNNQINVVISYSTRTENNTYDNKLTQSTIEKFLKRIGDNIAATHSDIAISGIIEYTNNNEEKASFERTKAGKYKYTHAFDKETLEKLIDEETDGYFNFNGISTKSLTISKYDITIREAKSTVSVKLYLNSNSSFTKVWGTASDKNNTPLTKSERKSAVSNQLEELQDLLIDATQGYDISIDVYYNDSSDCIASIDSDGKITTDTFTYIVS